MKRLTRYGPTYVERSSIRTFLVMLAAAVIVVPSAVALGVSAQTTSWLNLKQAMSPIEFKAAGLEKLSSSELNVLELWIMNYGKRAGSQSSGTRVTPRIVETPALGVIESQIDGDFEGWDGDTIFKLMNGQIWQQSSYAYTYHYSFMPDVIIYRGASGEFRMRVEDVRETIAVKRLK